MQKGRGRKGIDEFEQGHDRTGPADRLAGNGPIGKVHLRTCGIEIKEARRLCTRA